MTKIVQEVGGAASNQDAYTGEARQVTVDTDNWDIRLHDGVTAGGHPILSRDNGDARWQLKSLELDGFSFNPELRGFLVRQATGQYRIRVWDYDANVFTITNPDGYNGHPRIDLNTEVVGDRQFTGDVIITGVLQVDGGINADTAGTHTGNVVGNVTGNVTGNLTGNAAGNHTGSFTGDVDVSGQTLVLDDEQIPAAKVAGLTGFMDTVVPAGVIWIWSGAENAVPDGWEICNGLNGTPDLRDRFVIGCGTTLNYDVGDTGGAETHTHANTMDAAGAHTHGITVDGHALTESEMPAHKHGNGVTDSGTDVFNHGTLVASPTTSDSIDNNSNDGTIEGYTTTVGGSAAHTHTASSDSQGSHSHTLNNVAGNNMPPYYALCFIMRVL